MARITTNTTGTQPALVISSNVVASGSTYTATFNSSSDLVVPFLQDITVNNSTGVFSYTTFSDLDTRKLSTPADNSISTNIVIDDVAWFGDGGSPLDKDAKAQGLQYLSANKVLVAFKIYWDDNDGVGSTKKYRQGVGFITNLAPTVSPDAPIWVTPMEIAVDGSFTDGQNS